jgi:hypothetical protein
VNQDTLNIHKSAIQSNAATSTGGVLNRGTATIANSTITDNSADDLGGIAGISNGGDMTIKNSTNSGNHSDGDIGGISNTPLVTLRIQNTILANNTAEFGSLDCEGTITSLGNNIIGDTSGCDTTL